MPAANNSHVVTAFCESDAKIRKVLPDSNDIRIKALIEKSDSHSVLMWHARLHGRDARATQSRLTQRLPMNKTSMRVFRKH